MLLSIAAWRGSLHWAPWEAQEVVEGPMLSSSNPSAALAQTLSQPPLLLLPPLQTPVGGVTPTASPSHSWIH